MKCTRTDCISDANMKFHVDTVIVINKGGGYLKIILRIINQ